MYNMKWQKGPGMKKNERRVGKEEERIKRRKNVYAYTAKSKLDS